MKYRIEYEGKSSETVNGSSDLVALLQHIPAKETVTDIRKVYKSGISDSVMDIYGKHIRR